MRATRKVPALATFAIALAAAVLLPQAAQAIEIPSGFDLEAIVLDPFDSNPSGFAFLPDGRILLLEKNTGVVRLAVPGNITSVNVLQIPDMPFSFEQGLVGIAVDPEWPARPFVYFNLPRGNSIIQVLRYTAQGALTNPTSFALSFTDPFVILDDIPDVQGIHQAGTLRFGPDRFLYVSVGEDGSPCEAQNLSKLQGKILRINVGELGSGPEPPPKNVLAAPGNPYVDAGGNAALVYALGLRNPFRFTIDPLTGDLYLGDVGHNTWEEIDRIRFGVPGGNYGWPELEGPLVDPLPEADSCSTGPFAAPIFYYPHGQFGSSVICGPLVRPVNGGAYNFPPDYHGDLFIAEFYDGWIARLRPGPNGWTPAPSVPGQPNLQHWLSGLGMICDMQIGPDGGLYVMKLVNDILPRGLYRIAHTSTVDVQARLPALGSRALPNPARVGEGFTVQFAPERAGGRVSLQIFDPAGRLVRTLQAAGSTGVLRWDGRTGAGRTAPAGVYVYRLDGRAGPAASGKVTLVR